MIAKRRNRMKRIRLQARTTINRRAEVCSVREVHGLVWKPSGIGISGYRRSWA